MSNTLTSTPRATEAIAVVPASTSTGPYILRAVSAAGVEAFYSGRAGDFFVEGTPFSYQTIEGARRKADILNRGTALHGYHFTVVGLA